MRLASLLAAAAASLAVAAPTSDVFVPRDPTRLHGRFLHISDLHPDPWYRNGTAQRTSCHRGRPFGGDRAAGWYGHPVSSCDSPLSLINATFDYLRDHVAGQVDFVLLTGDSARHDSDSSLDRPLSEVAELNLLIGSKMYDTFAPVGVPVVFTIGNNDVGVHNTQRPGPSNVLDALHDAWHSFLPAPEHELFLSEGYFAREVIRGQLVVISLNTMWFFVSNGAVKGCKTRHDVGTRHLNWLAKRLAAYRKAGMQVHIMGHVPPTPAHWYPRCYKRYQRIVLDYQDTLLGQSFGHANVDYVDLLVHDKPRSKRFEVRALAPDELRDQYRAVPPAKKTDEALYSIVNVAPSVVPTYNPSMRIYSYNTSFATQYRQDTVASAQVADVAFNEEDEWSVLDTLAQLPIGLFKKRRKHRKARPPLHTSPDSPIRTNRFLTPLGYTQLYIDLPEANLRPEMPPQWQVEYETGEAYGMRDLTVGSWLELARRLAGDDDLYESYVDRFSVGTGAVL